VRIAMAVADRLFDAVELARDIQNRDRPGRCRIGDFAVFVTARPALAQIDEAKVVEAEIRHRPRLHADVDRELRPDEDHRRTSAKRRLRLVRPGGADLT
jgi:hypothetical protein